MPAPGCAYIGQDDRKRLQRRAICPHHPKEDTPEFMGVNSRGWLFICREGGHYFLAQPPKDQE